MTQTIQAVRGMNDILPDEAELWERFEETVRSWARSYGYRNIRTPLLEHTALFRRAIGEATDIVEKEMYSFVDELNGEHLTLRPEVTASIVRAAIEHSLLYGGPQRVWYMGPMYRHERPQKGRYRQFHQVDVEALGVPGPGRRRRADPHVRAAVGRPRPRRAPAASQFAGQSRRAARASRSAGRVPRSGTRASSTTIRAGDSSRTRCACSIRRIRRCRRSSRGARGCSTISAKRSLKHFDGVQAVLKDAAIPYTIDHRLVRGLDYYNLTVFEWITDRLGAQGTVCGGGRYDGLFEQIGGKASTAAGFAMGVERLIALMREGGEAEARETCDAYLVHQGEAADRFAFTVAERLRDNGFAVIQHAGGGSFKSQMKRADASGAEVAVIVGDDEAAAGEASVKPLRADRGQVRVPLDRLPALLTDMIYTDESK